VQVIRQDNPTVNIKGMIAPDVAYCVAEKTDILREQVVTPALV
jgi:hypothetical protein